MSYNIFDTFGFLSKLGEDEKQMLKSHSVIRKMDKGQLMLGDNNRCAGIPFAMEGSIRLFRTSEG